jgi:hypothetical protein
MGHSYVEFRGRDLLMHDIEITTVVSVVVDAIRSATGTPSLTPNVAQLVGSWEQRGDVYGPGSLGFSLDDFVRSDEDRRCLLDLLDFAAKRLEQQGAVVSGSYLDRIVNAPGVLEFTDRRTADILPAFAKFRDLLAAVVPGSQ